MDLIRSQIMRILTAHPSSDFIVQAMNSHNKEILSRRVTFSQVLKRPLCLLQKQKMDWKTTLVAVMTD
jgi:predicted dithiol-disulfide oxidoreductase (DUF899 family)